MSSIRILSQPIHEGSPCRIEVRGEKPVEVSIVISGKLIAKKIVRPPVVLKINLPVDCAGKTLRVSVPDDFDTAFILAP